MKVTTVGASWYEGRHRGIGPWIDLVHEVNRTRPGTFGQPEIRTDDNGYAEVYPGVEIRMVGTSAQDQLVTIVPTDPDIAEHVRAAAALFGLRVDE